MDRRRFVAGSGCALAVLAALRAHDVFAAATQTPQSQGSAGERLNALFDELMKERLRRDPERITSLGLDKGEYAWAKSKLTDASVQAAQEFKQDNASQLKRLRAFDRSQLKGKDLANYDTVEYTMETIARTVPFQYGDRVSPYVVSQLTGAYQDTPTFLDKDHTIANQADADAYLARLSAFATVLDQESARVQHDASLKVVPPDFLIDHTLAQMKALRATPAAQSILSMSIERRTRELGLTGDYGAKAVRIVEAEVYPALDRQAKVLADLRAHAVHDAGVMRLPQGAEFYSVALRQATTTDMTAEQIHQFGLEQAKIITVRLDVLLREQNLKDGTVIERLQALTKDPKYVYPNTDAGRQQILDYCNGIIKALQPSLPKYFRVLPKTAVEIRRVPAYTEQGAPGGYYERPPLDGSRPGAFYINLRDTSERPRWTLPTLVHHEAVPGHHFQLALVTEMPSLPLIRKAGGQFSANTEGWALYAEQLSDEMGLYDEDPLGRIGMLQAALFRAGRCVVDTGLHAKGWSREQAIDYMVSATGQNRASMTSEVERYCTWPGQATSYKVGQAGWLRMRAHARARLGNKFDIRDFHDVGLTAGTMPIAVLERVYEDWLKEHA
jgi:uncharacterized protein (DUF885 family)